MKKFTLFLSLVYVSVNFVVAQAPGIKWEKCLGGTYGEFAHKILKSRYGGYILAGNAYSQDYDVQGAHGTAYDGWVVRTNEAGQIIWQKCLGGTDMDFMQSAEEIEGGDIMVIMTAESTDGDVKDHIGDSDRDVWITRLDRNGNIKWSKSYGTPGREEGRDIKVTDDGFIFVASVTPSGPYATADVWIVKIDDSGNIIWDKKMNGSNRDEPYSLKTNSDGTFLVYGNTTSFDGDFPDQHGNDDLFLAKFNNDGSSQWVHLYGGSVNEKAGNTTLNQCNFIQCQDGGYLLLGYTNSYDQEVSGNHNPSSFVSYDAWVVKTDNKGNFKWQKCLGGTYDDFLYEVKEMPSGEFVLCGNSHSLDGDLTGITDRYDEGWLVKLTNNGELIWQKTIGGSFEDGFYGIEVLSADKLILFGSASSNDYDITGNHSYGFPDFILLEMGSYSSITGYAYIDNNLNNQKDSLEKFLENVLVSSKDNFITNASLTKNGFYKNNVDTGKSITSATFSFPYYTIVPKSQLSTFSDYNNSDTINFAFQPLPGKKDLITNIYSLTTVRPGFKAIYKLTYENVGTKDLDTGTITFIKDNKLNFESSTPVNDYINGDTIKWSYFNLKSLDTGSVLINLVVSVPPIANIGDSLHSYLHLEVNDDLTPFNNSDTLSQIILGSYDPNDKTENHGGSISKSNIANGDWLTYTIRFQNTGTDTAFNITIRDTLDSKLDWSSLEMVDASHNYQLNINDGNKCAWTFSNILLPDSNVNEAASHGYIVYRLKPKTTLVAGDAINNTASIYFDYNLPVQTNTEKTVIANDLILPLQLLSFSATHNGKTNLLKWSAAHEINTDHFEIQRSSNGRDFASIGNVRSLNNGKTKNDYVFADVQPVKAINYYRLKLIDRDGKFTYSAIRDVNNNGSFDVVIYPNPVHQNLTLNFNAEKAMNVQIEIINSEGKKINSSKIQLAYGSSLQQINIATFAAGNYFVKCITVDGQMGLKFVKQ